MIRKYIHQGSKTALTITSSWLIFISSIERGKKDTGNAFHLPPLKTQDDKKRYL